jgi:hypothetical protein
METISESTNTLQSLSQDLARVVERVSTAVMAINARRNSSSSGVCWRDGVIITAAHTLRRTETFMSSYRAVKRLPRLWQVLTQVGVAATGRATLQLSFFKRFSAKRVFSGA